MEDAMNKKHRIAGIIVGGFILLGAAGQHPTSTTLEPPPGLTISDYGKVKAQLEEAVKKLGTSDVTKDCMCSHYCSMSIEGEGYIVIERGPRKGQKAPQTAVFIEYFTQPTVSCSMRVWVKSAAGDDSDTFHFYDKECRGIITAIQVTKKRSDYSREQLEMPRKLRDPARAASYASIEALYQKLLKAFDPEGTLAQSPNRGYPCGD